MEVAAIVVQWGKFVNKSYNLLMILTQYHPTIIIIIVIIIDLSVAIVIICPTHLYAKVSRNGWSWVWRGDSYDPLRSADSAVMGFS